MELRFNTSPEILHQQNWDSMSITMEPQVPEFEDLLAELSAESCAHSWSGLRTSPTRNFTKQVMDLEARRRPTLYYLYWAHDKSGSQHLVGAATVGIKICHRLGHSGYPVLGRCFIRQAYREQGLYPLMFEQRLRACQSLFPESLRAVHVGIGSPRVREQILKPRPEFPLALYLGKEQIQVGSHTQEVDDYLLLTTRLCEELSRASLPIASSRCLMPALRRWLQQADVPPGANLQTLNSIREIIELADHLGARHEEF